MEEVDLFYFKKKKKTLISLLWPRYFTHAHMFLLPPPIKLLSSPNIWSWKPKLKQTTTYTSVSSFCLIETHIFLEVMCTKLDICINRGKGEGDTEKKVATSPNIFSSMLEGHIG